jgi:hypothetical protein
VPETRRLALDLSHVLSLQDSTLTRADLGVAARAALRASSFASDERAPPRQYLWKFGQAWNSLATGPTEMDLAQGVTRHQLRLRDVGQIEAANLVVAQFTEFPSAGLIRTAARWVREGAPVLHLGSHKYAAALAATPIPADAEIRSPWKAWLLEIPAGLIAATTAEGEQTDVVAAVVHADHLGAEGIRPGMTFAEIDALPPTAHWSITIFTGCECKLHMHDQPLSKLQAIAGGTQAFPVDGEEPDEDSLPSLLDMTTQDARAMQLVLRLVLGSCLAVTEQDPRTQAPRGSSGSKKHREGEPQTSVYSIGRPITIDCRPHVQAYVLGRRSPPSVQFLVRGHWRHQAHGPGHTERRWKWIEPFWKGSEDAPINLREHVVGKERADG